MLNSEIARIVYELNRAYRAAISEREGPAWADLPQRQKDELARAVNFHRCNTVSFEASHEMWLKARSEEGWKWGPQKDERFKLHPCMVNWRALPTSQRVKDVLFVTLVKLLGDSD